MEVQPDSNCIRFQNMPSYFINSKGRVYSSSDVNVEANGLVPSHAGEIMIHKSVIIEWEGGKLAPHTVEAVADELHFK